MKILRTTITLVIFILSLPALGQELHTGIDAGIFAINENPPAYTFGGILEYRPLKSIVSLNSGVSLIANKANTVYSFPLFFKFIIGNQLRVCPSAGGYLRTNGHYGWSSGLNLEYRIREKLFVYSRAEYNRNYWKVRLPSHSGAESQITDNGSIIWIRVGLKKNIL